MSKIFYTLENNYNGDPKYLCEWEVVADQPVHQRHVDLSAAYVGDDSEMVVWTTWITPTYVYVFGWDDNLAPGPERICLKVDRATMAVVGQPAMDDLAGGSPGGVTNLDGKGLVWIPYDVGPHIYVIDETLTILEDVAIYPAAGFGQYYFGDIASDGRTLYMGRYNSDAIVKRGDLIDNDELVNFFDLDAWFYPQYDNYSTFETPGDTGVWSVLSNCTIDNFAIAGPAGGGSRSLRVVSSSSAPHSIQSPLYPLVDNREGRSIQLTATYRALSGTKAINFYVHWYDAANTFISQTGGTSDTYTTTWETRSFAHNFNPPVGATQYRYVIIINVFSATTTYFDFISGQPEDPQARQFQEAVKYSQTEECLYLAFDFDNGCYPGHYNVGGITPSQWHTAAILRLDNLESGLTCTDWWPIDPTNGTLVPKTMDQGDAFTTGLVLTPDDGHIVWGQGNFYGSGVSQGAIFCKNLDTGAEGFAFSPHPGTTGPGPYSTLQHVGAYHNVSLTPPIIGKLSFV